VLLAKYRSYVKQKAPADGVTQDLGMRAVLKSTVQLIGRNYKIHPISCNSLMQHIDFINIKQFISRIYPSFFKMQLAPLHFEGGGLY
jgi:hypothetical protein